LSASHQRQLLAANRLAAAGGIPRATMKKAAATANHLGKRLDQQRYKLVAKACDEILAGLHHDMFPLHVWMTGSGTQFNMNFDEVISTAAASLPVRHSAARRRSIPTITSTWCNLPTTHSLRRCISRRPSV
jgi:fumarate hydratase class II